MIRIYCSKALSKFIGSVENTLPKDALDLKPTDWNGHIFYLNRKKCVIFVHALTHYSIFLTGIIKKDILCIDELLFVRLYQQLIHDRIVENISQTKEFIPLSSVALFKTNNNRKVTGRINDFTSIFEAHCKIKYENVLMMDIEKETGIINSTPIQLTINGKKSWTSPNQQMKKLLKATIQ